MVGLIDTDSTTHVDARNRETSNQTRNAATTTRRRPERHSDARRFRTEEV